MKIPIRPINSCIGSPTYQVSKYLAYLLKWLFQSNEYSVKNRKEFSDFVRTQRLDKDETIVSFDVVSLFTSVPVEFAIDIVKRRLAETDKWKNYTSLTAKEIVDLLTFVLKNSFSSAGENFYHQISGCAMGSPVSAVIAELVMKEVETMALATSPV